MARCPKWGKTLKADFRNHIENRRINPESTDKAYILGIRDKYYKDRPDNTFLANWKASVAEWRAGFYVNEYNKSKKKGKYLVSWLMSLLYKTNFFSSSSSASKTTAAATDDDEYISAEDEDYAAEGEEEASVSLGSEDTDIDPDEVQDLEEDAAKMPRTPGSTKKSANSASAKKKSAQDDPMDDLVADIAKLNMNSMAPDFNYHCPVTPYHYKEGLKHLIAFDVQFPSVPKENLKYLRVEPGGKQVAFLIASPKFYTQEKVLKQQLGHAYKEDSARTAARYMQVTHPANKKYPGRENFIEGKPQVINLPFKCVEGDLKPVWNYWAEGQEKLEGKKYVHQQFAINLHFEVESVGSYTQVYEDDNKNILMDDFVEEERMSV
eukprot:scaffold49001_cov77-Cyclotella_meneghiniana.AAC.1